MLQKFDSATSKSIVSAILEQDRKQKEEALLRKAGIVPDGQPSRQPAPAVRQEPYRTEPRTLPDDAPWSRYEPKQPSVKAPDWDDSWDGGAVNLPDVLNEKPRELARPRLFDPAEMNSKFERLSTLREELGGPDIDEYRKIVVDWYKDNTRDSELMRKFKEHDTTLEGIQGWLKGGLRLRAPNTKVPDYYEEKSDTPILKQPTVQNLSSYSNESFVPGDSFNYGVKPFDPNDLELVGAREYAEENGATVNWKENYDVNGTTYAKATVEFHGKSYDIQGPIDENGNMLFDAELLNNKFGWGSDDPLVNTVLASPNLDKFAKWDEPYMHYTHSVFDGITEHRIVWPSENGATSITLYEGSKESMKAWADSYAQLSGYLNAATWIESIVGAIGLGTGALAGIAGVVSSWPAVVIGGLLAAASSEVYSAQADYIIDKTYFEGDYVYFAHNASVSTLRNVTIYGIDGNKSGPWGH